MRTPALLLAALVSCSDGGDQGDVGDDSDDSDGGSDDGDGDEPEALRGITAEALRGITAAQNEVRAAHGVDPLSWSPTLATIARGWAEQCVDQEAPVGLIDHNPGRSDGYGGYVGENVYGSGGPASGPDAVAAWASEETSYHHDSNTCDSLCGHYTQIVWAATKEVGCDVHSCPGLTYGNSIVCNYAPGGNDGGRPY